MQPIAGHVPGGEIKINEQGKAKQSKAVMNGGSSKDSRVEENSCWS